MTRRWNISPSRRVGGHWRIGYGQENDFLQCAALHLRDGYLRLAPHTGWGTSVILPPSFWKQGRLYQGAPITVQPSIQQQNLLLAITSCRGGLKTNLRVVLSPPHGKSLKVSVTANVEGCITLDKREGEAFKPVVLSSMHVGPQVWDARAVTKDEQVVPLTAEQERWLFAPISPTARSFGLQGGSSQWKRDAPTIIIRLDHPLTVAGWHTRSQNPNDDNVALWASSPHVLTSWRYEITAQSASL